MLLANFITPELRAFRFSAGEVKIKDIGVRFVVVLKSKLIKTICFITV